MITTILINVIYILLSGLFGLLPHVTTMPEWYAKISDNIGVFSALNGIPIMGTFFEIAILIITLQAGWQAVVFTNWIYNKIRGSG